MNVNPVTGIKEAFWVFIVAFVLSWFGPSPSVHAGGPPLKGGYPDGTNIQSPLATASWTGAVNTLWSNAGNWTAGSPPGATGNAVFDANFTTSNQPDANGVTTGGIWMTSTVTRNVTISGQLLTIAGGVAPTFGIRVDNSAFTLTMHPPTILTFHQAWTNNSTLAGNALIVEGTNNLTGQQVTFDGVGNTLVTGVMGGKDGSIVKNGTGTTTLTALNTYTGPTTVNGGLLLVNGAQVVADILTTVNSGGALGELALSEAPWSSTREGTLRLEMVAIRQEF